MSHLIRRSARTKTFPLESLEPRRLLSSRSPAAFVIDGVQPAALDQPQTHMLLHRSAKAAPLSANDGVGGTSFDVQAFLDTGTSGMLLSQETATGLGIASELVKGKAATYSDIGVAGNENFDVSEPLYTAIAPFTPNADVDNINSYKTVYNQTLGPVRTEISRTAADDLTGPLDIVGMPAMVGKVVVMDPSPVNTGLDTMRTYLYNPGTPFNAATQDTNPGIPTVNRHIKLSYGSFDRFTQLTPSGAAGPTLAANPFIGPNPINKLLAKPPVDTTPPVSLAEGKYTGTGSFLFDTGAAASFISSAMASNLHVVYKRRTYNSANPILVDATTGVPIANQFQIPLGGIGGQINAAGFFLDSLSLPTVEGAPIKFTHAPVLVADVTTTDPVTKQSLTLDGDFGMNFLVASVNINGSTLGDTRAGAFPWVTFDQPHGLLGVQLPSGAAATVAIAALASSAAGASSSPASVTQLTSAGGASAQSLVNWLASSSGSQLWDL